MGSPSSRRYQRTRARRSLASGGEMSHGRCAELPSTDTTDVISGTGRERKGRMELDRSRSSHSVDARFDYAFMVSRTFSAMCRTFSIFSMCSRARVWVGNIL